MSNKTTKVPSTQFFKALCDENRLSILKQLANVSEGLNVNAVAKCLCVDLSVVSRHLATLRDAGILAAEKRGKEVYYSVKAKELIEALRSMADYLDTCCGPKSGKKGGENHGKESERK